MEREYNALDIAIWFVYKTNAEKRVNQGENDDFEVYEGLTHLKLQKLLYFAQGLSLAINNETLFSDQIEAWGHGPVVRTVYNMFSRKGREEITLDDVTDENNVISRIESDGVISNILNLTYDNFAIYTAWQLRNMTHEKGTPWDAVYEPNKNNIIETNSIREYFLTNVVE